MKSCDRKGPRGPHAALSILMGFSLVQFAGARAQASTESRIVKTEQVTAQCFADREAVVPGQILRMAVSLKITPGWHIYWRSPGESEGLPTQFTWSVPDGYRARRTQFPIPEEERSAEPDKIALGHTGTAVFITPIEVPADAAGPTATFKVQARWLVCKESCLLGDAELSITLPVASGGAAPRTANAKLFEDAERLLPLGQKRSQFVTLSGNLDRDTVKPGDEFTARLIVDIKPGHHMQSDNPTDPDLIAAKVLLEETPGLEFGTVVFPKAHEREDPILGKLREFDGKIEIAIPVTVDSDADEAPRWIRGLLRHQVCNESGTCFPPEHVEFAIPVRMAGGPAPVDDAAADQGQLGPAGSSALAAGGESQNILLRIQDRLFARGIVGVIVAAFLGGLILNLMPCVLPVISLKVLSFVRQAQEDRGRIFRLSLAYCGGIMAFYVLLAYLFFAFGKGWGELFQNPVFVIAMAAVVLAFALSLFGVFSVFAPTIVNKLGEKAEGEGYSSAFFTGVLATLLGTACTAPFLSAAIAYASRLPITQGVAIFLSVGVGMAFPFLILGYKPAWVRFVPKPGPWFGVFEAAMGFLLLGTVIWLLNPLRGQIGDFGLLLSTIFLLAVAIAVWIKGKIAFGDPIARKARLYTLAIAILAAGWLLPFRAMATIDSLVAEHVAEEDFAADGRLLKELLSDSEIGPKLSGLLLPRVDWSTAKGIPWQQYRRARAMLAVQSGYTVFVDYTADWCASCKANLKSSIDREQTIAVMKELNVIPYEADYTLTRPEITEDLRKFGRAGVPLYLVYSPGEPDTPQILPEVLTPEILIDALRKAGPSRAKSTETGGAGIPTPSQSPDHD